MAFAERALSFAAAWLNQPALAIPVLLLLGILFGLGKALGLPRLFWSRKGSEQFQAGLAFALVSLETILACTLLRGVASAEEATWFAVSSAALGLAATLAAAALARRRRSGQRGRLTAAIRSAPRTALHPGPREESATRPWAFLGGMVLAAALVAGMTLAAFFMVPQRCRDTLVGFMPSRAQQLPELHVLAGVGFVTFLGCFLVPRKHVPAAAALCALFGLVIAVHGFLNFWGLPAGVELLLLAALLALGGAGAPARIRLAELANAYHQPVHYPPESEARGLLDFNTGLRALAAQRTRKLIVVCTSGGGIRAATWTAAVLSRLEQLPGFVPATRWISGASGGMVGAAFWRMASRPLPSWRLLPETVARDSLTPMVRQLVFNDIPLAFTPCLNPRDRGNALQEAWCENFRTVGNLHQRIADLRASETDGTWPSLVFSPMLVEDGRRLLISNLDLRPATDQLVRWLSSLAEPNHSSVGLASKTGYALEALIPGALTHLNVATAARLSASFPYVSPAVVLPTTPRRRVVDAGYYDNYGLELACGWLRALLEYDCTELRKNVDAILVIQIRDNVSELSINPSEREEFGRLRARAKEESRFLRGFEGLTSPLEGVLQARDSSMLFRNDRVLESVTQLYGNTFASPDYLTTTVFDFAGEASLSWRLDDDERDLLLAQAESPGIQQKLDAIRAWL